MNDAARNYNGETCIVCGQAVRFYNDEFKKPCKKCGTWIFEQRNYAKQKRQSIKSPKCWACRDKGIVEYQIQRFMGIYNFLARCTCPEGLKWPSKIPLLDQCDYAPKIECLERRNKEFYKKHFGEQLTLIEEAPMGFEPVDLDEELPF